MARWIVLLGVVFLAACAGTPAAVPATPVPVSENVDMNAEAEPLSEPTAVAPAPEPEPTAPAAPEAAASRVFVIDSAQSSVEYAVDEVFLSENRPYRAVGVTNAIEGEFQVAADGAIAGEVTRMRVDLRTLKSDSPRRDNAIRGRWLESDTYPYADFVSTDALDLPTDYAEGDEVTFTLVGDMTVRDVTKSVTWVVTGVLQDGVVTGQATTSIVMSDFGFDPPNIANMIKVEDKADLTVNFVATEQP
jgi:polyisoprenoid-binding protein YceI